MEILDLTQCKSNGEVLEAVKERVRSVDCDDLIRELSNDFIYHEEATRKIYAALALGKNSILYGPGGFGKSVLVKAVCKKLGIPVIYKVGYKGMTPEELLGVPNMQKLLNESTYETAFENSVFSQPGILILEEFFDADPSTAAALKDILTERGFREGNSRKESLIASVIITGNKTPEDVSIDDSTKAFYEERFPFRHEMIWDRFDEKNYFNFFKVYYKEICTENADALLLVAKLCASTEKRISPRVATQAADTAMGLGVAFLDTVTDLDTSLVDEMKRQVEKELVQITEIDLLEKIKRKVIALIDDIRTPEDMHHVIDCRAQLSTILEHFSNENFSNDVYNTVIELRTLIQRGLGTTEHLLLDYADLAQIEEDVKELFYGKSTS